MTDAEITKITRWTNQAIDYRTIATRIGVEPKVIITWLKSKDLPVHYRYRYKARLNGDDIYFLNVNQAAKFLGVHVSTLYNQLDRYGSYRTKENGMFRKVPGIGIKKMWPEDKVYLNRQIFDAKKFMKESEWI